MPASAGVFTELALRALRHVEVEFLCDRLVTFLGPDLQHHRQFLAFGDHLVGYKFVAIFGESELRWIRAVAHGDRDDLSGGRDHFAGVVEEADFHFLFRSDEELGVGRDG